jgi:hypothetical protein
VKYRFNFRGHREILGDHKTTLEFTKDSFLTKRGNCIIGVKADFEVDELKKFLRCEKIKIGIRVHDFFDELIAVPNKNFNDNHEIVIRIGEFISPRTFAVNATKASKDINRKLINALKQDKIKGIVEIEGI